MFDFMHISPHQAVEQNCAPEIWIDRIHFFWSLQKPVVAPDQSLSTISVVPVLRKNAKLVLIWFCVNKKQVCRFTKIPAVRHKSIRGGVLAAVECSASFAHPKLFIAPVLRIFTFLKTHYLLPKMQIFNNNPEKPRKKF